MRKRCFSIGQNPLTGAGSIRAAGDLHFNALDVSAVMVGGEDSPFSGYAQVWIRGVDGGALLMEADQDILRIADGIGKWSDYNVQ